MTLDNGVSVLPGLGGLMPWFVRVGAGGGMTRLAGESSATC